MGFCFQSFSKTYLLLVVQSFFSCALSLSLSLIDSGDEIADFCSEF
jgi:hypothetical protein